MLLKSILYFASVFSLISGASIKSKRDTSDSDYEAWLRELESQIIVNSEELQKGDFSKPHPKPETPEIPPVKVDYDTAQEVKEPIVVTSKPYLTGDKNQVEEESVTENINENESDETTTTENGTIIGSEDDQVQEQDSQRSRKLLDKILAQTPTNHSHHHKHSSQQLYNSEDTGSEVKSFVVLVKNQTPMIILGVVLSLLVLVALTVTIYQVLKNLGQNSSITLVSHYECEDGLDNQEKNLKS